MSILMPTVEVIDMETGQTSVLPCEILSYSSIVSRGFVCHMVNIRVFHKDGSETIHAADITEVVVMTSNDFLADEVSAYWSAFSLPETPCPTSLCEMHFGRCYSHEN